jgi:hypothetical protein
MGAVTELMDHLSDRALAVLKCLKIIYVCLKLSPQTFQPAAQAFAPEIQTICLLSFDSPQEPLRDLIHQLANCIYLAVFQRGQLPSADEIGVVMPDQQRPPARKRVRPSEPEDLIGFGTSKEKVDEDKPRVPAAFSGGRVNVEELLAARKGFKQETGETESLLSFDDDEDTLASKKFGEAKPPPKKPKKEKKAESRKDFDLLDVIGNASSSGDESPESDQTSEGSDDDLLQWQDEGLLDDAEGSADLIQKSKIKDNGSGSGLLNGDLFEFDEGLAFQPVAAARNTDIDLFDSLTADGDSKPAVKHQNDLFDPFSEQPPQVEREKVGKKSGDDTELFDLFQGAPAAGKEKKRTAVGDKIRKGSFDPLGEADGAKKEPEAEDGGVFDPFAQLSAEPKAKKPATAVVTKPVPIPEFPKRKVMAKVGGRAAPQKGVKVIKAVHQGQNPPFDPFAAAVKQPSADTKSDDLFDPFGDQPVAGAKQSGVFDPFGVEAQPPQPKSDSFDPFDDIAPPPQPSSKKIDDFDLFGAPQVTRSPPNTGGDLFDPFSEQLHVAPPSKKVEIDQTSINETGKGQTEGSELFDPFAELAKKDKKPSADIGVAHKRPLQSTSTDALNAMAELEKDLHTPSRPARSASSVVIVEPSGQAKVPPGSSSAKDDLLDMF